MISTADGGRCHRSRSPEGTMAEDLAGNGADPDSWMVARPGKGGAAVGLARSGLTPSDQPLLSLVRVEVMDVDLHDLTQKAVRLAFLHHHRHECLLGALRIASETARPLRLREPRRQEGLRQDSDHAPATLEGILHLQHEVTSRAEIPLLKHHRVARCLQHVGDPRRPCLVSGGVGDEEVFPDRFHRVSLRPRTDKAASRRLVRSPPMDRCAHLAEATKVDASPQRRGRSSSPDSSPTHTASAPPPLPSPPSSPRPA